MPTLIFDRRVPLSEQRLRVALSKLVRKKGKKHGTGKRTAAQKRANKAKRLHNDQANAARQRERRAAALAYWRGEAMDMSGRG